MTTAALHLMDEAAAAVKEFRQTLIDAGFRHANAAGELVSADDTTWVGTCYAYGEYTIYAWRRPRGIGERGEKRQKMQVFPHTDFAVVEALGKRLARWAKKPRKNATWPPEGLA